MPIRVSLLRWLEFQLRYIGKPRWDTGVSPPELTEYIQSNPAGSAIDIGCGTGTNAITLARAGWQVMAVDFVARALRAARRKALVAGVQIDFRVQDITTLGLVASPFDLALDIGCFHGVGDRTAYLGRLETLLRPGGHWLMYGFYRAPDSRTGPGLSAQDVESIARTFAVLRQTDGTDPRGRPSSWFLFQKPIRPVA